MYTARSSIGDGFFIDAIPPASSTARAERIVDLLLAGSLLGWAGKWGYDFFAVPQSRGGVTLLMAIFQGWVGVLFLLREPVSRPGGIRATLLSAPSVLFSGIALKLSAGAIFWKIGRKTSLS